MTLARTLTTRSRVVAPSHSIVAYPKVPVTCEALEARQLLTAYTYTVPTATPPHTAVYLQPTGTAGQVRVRLDSPTGTIGTTFTNTTGMDIIDCGSLTNFLFVDQVPAASKPTSDANGDNGIKVQGGSGGTLRIEPDTADQLVRLTASTRQAAEPV